jgi:hypothetical protein
MGNESVETTAPEPPPPPPPPHPIRERSNEETRRTFTLVDMDVFHQAGDENKIHAS